MKSLNSWSATSLLPYIISCNKIDLSLGLPAPTQIGANTFGCKINGEVWRVKTGKEKRKYVDDGVEASVEDSILYISASDLGWKDEIPNYDFQLKFKVDSASGSFTTKNIDKYIHVLNRREGDIELLQEYRSDSTAILDLTKMDKNIVAGKFEGNLVNSRGGINLIITDGRFDIKLK